MTREKAGINSKVYRRGICLSDKGGKSGPTGCQYIISRFGLYGVYQQLPSAAATSISPHLVFSVPVAGYNKPQRMRVAQLVDAFEETRKIPFVPFDGRRAIDGGADDIANQY